MYMNLCNSEHKLWTEFSNYNHATASLSQEFSIRRCPRHRAAYKILLSTQPEKVTLNASLFNPNRGVLQHLLYKTGEGNGNPLQCSCLENPRGGSLVG